MAKKKKSKTVPVRPKTSPYTSPPITVYFGVERRRYHVHDALLQRLESLPDPSPWTSEVALEDVDADTGHTLIHFLHTGVYQTLDKMADENLEVGEKDTVISEFQKAVRASEAATKYGLPGLQQLAQAEVDRGGANMSLHDVIRAISEDFIARSLDENTWLQEYVSQKVRSAFELNSEAFLEQDFFERISSHTLTKILAKNVVSLYSQRVSDLQRERMVDGKASPSENGGHPSSWVNLHPRQLTSDRPAPNVWAWPKSLKKVEVFDDPSATKDSHILDDGKSLIPEADASISPQRIAGHAEDATRVEAPDSTLADPIFVSVEPEASNTVLVLSGAGTNEPKVEEEVLRNSQASVLYPSTEPPAGGPMPSASTAEDMMVGSNPTQLTKKQKKMQKKKMHKSTVTPDLPPVPNPEPIFDDPSKNAFPELSTVVQESFNRQEEEQMGREKFPKEGVERLKPAPEETDCLRTPEEQTFVQRTVEVTSAVGLTEPFADIVPDGAEKKQDDFGWGDWGSTPISSKKKKKKKGANYVLNHPVPTTDEAEPEPKHATGPGPSELAPEPALTVGPPSTEKEEDSWGEEWGGTQKKKKGKGKAKYETPPLEPEKALDSDLIV